MNICLPKKVSVRLLSTHNICFGSEIRKLFFYYTLLTKGLQAVTGTNLPSALTSLGPARHTDDVGKWASANTEIITVSI